MRKGFTYSLLAGMTAVMLAGCGGGGSSSSKLPKADTSKEGKVINVVLYQDTMKNYINDHYPEVESVSKDGEDTILKDGTKIHWIVNASEVFQTKLDELLKKQDYADPDERIEIIDLEGDYMKKYLEAGVCVPLEDIGITAEDMAQQYPNTKEAITVDGKVCGASVEVAPGLFAYRRSIAKDVLGTDDPDQVQEALSDWDKFDAVAEKAKEKGYYMLSGFADAYRVFSNNMASPWVADNKVVKVDPAIMSWIDMTKRYTDAGYNHKTTNVFTEDWMKDQGADGKVFGFFYSTWGINFTLVGNAGDEGFGDWAVCKGPKPFYWGASWLVAAKNTDNPKHIKDILLAMTCNKDIMKKLSTDVNTFVNNSEAMTEIASDPNSGSEFLGGQNHIALFNEVAPNINYSNICAYDQGCTLDMIYSFADYFLGNISLDEAKKAFETAVKERYPNLTDVVWPKNS
ncbi:MAG: carbohydrate ABC transporter substrate-binding protein [Lachnospiraceae bacterium]|nr:carbohydrate ABC transporter substrate-binding protein [Lachnospiraceae bacterium]